MGHGNERDDGERFPGVLLLLLSLAGGRGCARTRTPGRSEGRCLERRRTWETKTNRKKSLLLPKKQKKQKTLHSRSYFFSNSPVRWRLTKVVLPVGEVVGGVFFVCRGENKKRSGLRRKGRKKVKKKKTNLRDRSSSPFDRRRSLAVSLLSLQTLPRSSSAFSLSLKPRPVSPSSPLFLSESSRGETQEKGRAKRGGEKTSMLFSFFLPLLLLLLLLLFFSSSFPTHQCRRRRPARA